MERWEIGMLVKSLAGHDKDQIYLIADLDETYVYLVNGTQKTFEHRKKKKRIHVQLIRTKYEIEALDNVSVRHIVKEYARRNEGGYKNVESRCN